MTTPAIPACGPVTEPPVMAWPGVTGLIPHSNPIVASVDLAMIREVRRLGGLLKHVHNESGGAYSETTARALSDIRAYIERLSHDRQEG